MFGSWPQWILCQKFFPKDIIYSFMSTKQYLLIPEEAQLTHQLFSKLSAKYIWASIHYSAAEHKLWSYSFLYQWKKQPIPLASSPIILARTKPTIENMEAMSIPHYDLSPNNLGYKLDATVAVITNTEVLFYSDGCSRRWANKPKSKG